MGSARTAVSFFSEPQVGPHEVQLHGISRTSHDGFRLSPASVPERDTYMLLAGWRPDSYAANCITLLPRTLGLARNGTQRAQRDDASHCQFPVL